LETGRTLFHDARRVEPEQLTLCDAFVVVAPIANQAGETIGALYGIRHDHPQNQRRGIRPLEAQFVQAVAETVSASMQRLEKEREAAKLRVRMEQVFSPGLARELERNPRLLEGDQREITVMFADMRGFSSLSEQLSPHELYQLLGDAMDRLTAVILRQEGILIDYYGDGFSAFWNAPVPQPNHAYLACEAARQIQRELEDLNADWQGFTGRRLRMGIGIHTGIALVGNSGSRQRIKYGPRGSTVNLAARIENATKQLGVPILMSGESQRLLGTALPTQRVFRQTFEGMSKPVDLYQPLESERTNTQVLETFAQALAAFDKQQWEPSLEILEQLRAAGYSDAPLDHLLRKTREHFTPTLGSRLL
jgi:adenylate cyclase